VAGDYLFYITAYNQAVLASITKKLFVSVLATNSALTLSYPSHASYVTLGQSLSLVPTVSGLSQGGLSFEISPALPANTFAIDATTGVVSGTPTVEMAASVFRITVTNANKDTGSTVLLLSITPPKVPVPFAYPATNLIAKRNQPFTSPTPNLGPLSYDIWPALPSGLSFDRSTGIISGTPTVVSTQQYYKITATDRLKSTTGVAYVSLLIVDDDVQQLRYSNQNPLGPPLFSPQGGVPLSFSISPPLPRGMSFDSATGTISGVPITNLPTQITGQYQVTAFSFGGNVTITFSLTVAAPGRLQGKPLPLIYHTTNGVYTVGAEVNNIPISAPSSCAFAVSPALLSGLSLAADTGIITGVPSVTTPSPVAYTVSCSNLGVSALITIAVNDVAPRSLIYLNSPRSVTFGKHVEFPNITFSGGVPSTFSVVPALPSGLTLGPMGSVRGVPTKLSPLTTYLVTASNSGGTGTTQLQFAVVDVPPQVAYNPSNIYTSYLQSIFVRPFVSQLGGNVTLWSIHPKFSVGYGLNFDEASGVISGVPLINNNNVPDVFTVTATNSGGSSTVFVKIFTSATGDQFTIAEYFTDNRSAWAKVAGGISVAFFFLFVGICFAVWMIWRTRNKKSIWKQLQEAEEQRQVKQAMAEARVAKLRAKLAEKAAIKAKAEAAARAKFEEEERKRLEEEERRRAFENLPWIDGIPPTMLHLFDLLEIDQGHANRLMAENVQVLDLPFITETELEVALPKPRVRDRVRHYIEEVLIPYCAPRAARQFVPQFNFFTSTVSEANLPDLDDPNDPDVRDTHTSGSEEGVSRFGRTATTSDPARST